MTTAEFLAHLHTLDIRLTVNGARLRCSAPKGVLTDQLRAELVTRKAEILALLPANESDQDISPETPIFSRDGHPQLGTALQLQDDNPLTSVSDGLAESLADTSNSVKPAPMRRQREGNLPLSFSQRRLWFLDQLEPGSSAYVLMAWKRFLGPLDFAALARAFTELVRRHEALRTTFVNTGGEPAQRIADPKPVALEIIDLTTIPQTERREAARWTIQEQSRRKFDLGYGPLFRPVLIRLSPEDHELLIIVHHIVADGWSMNIILKELLALYEAEQTGRPSLLPEPSLQYADFALWQQQWLSGSALEPHRQYWLTQLGGRPTTLDLPIDQPRSQRPTSAGASHQFLLPPSLVQRLRELSRSEGTTLFMTLLAAFKVLLARYTDQEDIVVGTPVANRNYVELESVVGFFANTLALYSNLGGDPSFRALLARVRETCLGAYAHQEMPFDTLVQELRPERSLNQNPLFQVSFVWEDAETGADVAFLTVASPFDLTLFVRNWTDGALSATIQYKRDLFEPETIERFARHFSVLLEGVVRDPDCQLSQLPLLDADEMQQLLVGYNTTTTAYPRDRSIHRLFEEQVDATPDAVALVSEGVSLTYRDLDQQANRLAQYLLTLGVGPQHLVGVWMERSIDAIIALLGVLKAGGAYVPFDLLAPPERLTFMLNDAKIDLLLTQERLLGQLPQYTVRTLCLDAKTRDIETQPDSRLGRAGNAESLAYVMYTSGSTGKPKGVAVEHRSVVRLVKNTDYTHFGPDEVFLQFAALSFDASTFEIWGALLNGGRLAIAPPGMLSIEELGVVLARYRVTTLWLTAGLFHQVVDHRLEILRPLRQLLAGGDVLSPDHVNRMLAELPDCRMVNGYGPTEGTTFTCCHTVTMATENGRSVPIGHPIANSRVYVLDRFLRPVPLGVPGELCVAGDGLARGYVSHPELTAERFVERRFSPTLQERLYRTGDRVRRLRDGTIEFLGRLDNQVKVRGYRVELSEVEAALARHPHVREVAVVAHRTVDSDTRLVAYVAGNNVGDAHDLRQLLRSILPDYMIPAAFVVLDHLPLTVSGKIDRQALPEPKRAGQTVAAAVTPRDELERQLVEMWQKVLSINPIGVYDNFFDLGGHSLLAVRMFAQVQEQLQVMLPLATLFQAPTIAELASFIRGGAPQVSGRSLVAIQSIGSQPPVFGVPGVGGNVLSYNALVQYLGPDQPFYGLQSRGLDGQEKPLVRIEDIATEFLREIRAVQPHGPYYLVGACMGGVVAYEMAQQLRIAGQEIGLLALLETWLPQTTSTHQARVGGQATATIKFITGRLRLYWETFTRLHGHERRQYLLERLRLIKEIFIRRDVFRGARAEFHQEIVTEANQLAFQHYKPRVYPGPAVLFVAEERQVPLEDDRRLAWRDLITGGLEIYHTPGDDSGDMLMAPQVQLLAARLQQCLTQAQAAHAVMRDSGT